MVCLLNSEVIKRTMNDFNYYLYEYKFLIINDIENIQKLQSKSFLVICFLNSYQEMETKLDMIVTQIHDV